MKALDLGEAMAGWNAMSAGARGALVAGGAVVVAVAGYFGLMRGPEAVVVAPEVVVVPAQTAAQSAVAPEAEVAAVETPAVAGAATEAPAAAEAPAEAAAAEATVPDVVEAAPVAPSLVPEVGAAAAILPSFDVARVAADGAATVAGVAAPGAAVKVMLDGVEVARVTADAQGKFATLFDVAPGPAARMLSLVATGVDGEVVAGADRVALAPIVAEKVVTDAPALPAPPAVLVAPEGVKVLQSGADASADPQGKVAVDTISYAPDGAVRLGGRAAAGAGLRLYLDGAAIADVTTGGDGTWAATLRDVAAGIYTLRVDQLAADGSVTARFETPFKRETLEALAAAAETAGQAQDTSVAAAPATGSATASDMTPAPEAPAVAAETADAAAKAAPVVSEPAAAAPGATEPAATTPEPTAGTQMGSAVQAVAAPAPKPAPVTVTVQPGYTLWGIAQQNFGDGVMYVQVFEANKAKIKNPDLIYPGQVFTIPAAP